MSRVRKARTIVVLNQKGGVGKTATAVNLGAALVRRRRSVLLVDLDPQAHLSASLGVFPGDGAPTSWDLLDAPLPLPGMVHERHGLHVVPASLRLAEVEQDFRGRRGRETLLRDHLRGTERYDFVFLDPPPTLGLLTVNALTAADEILIPLQAEFLALYSLVRLLDTVEAVRRRLHPDLAISGVVATRYSPRRRLNREVMEKVKERLGDVVFQTTIRENIVVAEAPSFGKDVFSYRPRSNGAEDFAALAAELLRRRRRWVPSPNRKG